MIIDNEILINKYGQDLLSLEELINSYHERASIKCKRIYLTMSQI